MCKKITQSRPLGPESASCPGVSLTSYSSFSLVCEKRSAWGSGRVKIIQNPRGRWRGRVEVDKKGILRTAIFPWNTVSVALTLSNWLVKTCNNVSYQSKELNYLHESMFKLLYIHISDLLEQNISGRYFCEAIIYFARVFSLQRTVTKTCQQK